MALISILPGPSAGLVPRIASSATPSASSVTRRLAATPWTSSPARACDTGSAARSSAAAGSAAVSSGWSQITRATVERGSFFSSPRTSITSVWSSSDSSRPRR